MNRVKRHHYVCVTGLIKNSLSTLLLFSISSLAASGVYSATIMMQKRQEVIGRLRESLAVVGEARQSEVVGVEK